jgi:predicted nucleic acid-binding protein
VTLADTDRAKTLLVTLPGVSVRDAVHGAVMLNHDISEIATFDEGFDALDGITRVPLR